MSVTTTATTVAPTTAPVKPLVTGGLTAAAGASAVTAALAAAGRAAGTGLAIGGKPIPVFMFAVLTALFSLAGLALALILARKARRPRAAFVRTTIALTVLSLVPDVLADTTAASKAVLMLTHLAAAAIVIPAIARRLNA